MTALQHAFLAVPSILYFIIGAVCFCIAVLAPPTDALVSKLLHITYTLCFVLWLWTVLVVR